MQPAIVPTILNNHRKSPAIPILISFDFSCTAIAQLPEYEISTKNRGIPSQNQDMDLIKWIQTVIYFRGQLKAASSYSG